MWVSLWSVHFLSLTFQASIESCVNARDLAERSAVSRSVFAMRGDQSRFDCLSLCSSKIRDLFLAFLAKRRLLALDERVVVFTYCCCVLVGLNWFQIVNLTKGWSVFQCQCFWASTCAHFTSFSYWKFVPNSNISEWSSFLSWPRKLMNFLLVCTVDYCNVKFYNGFLCAWSN